MKKAAGYAILIAIFGSGLYLFVTIMGWGVVLAACGITGVLVVLIGLAIYLIGG